MHASTSRFATVFLVILAMPALSLAVIVIGTDGSPTRNLSAPTGALADSGWQYEGNWSGFLGTPISADCFITAAHINPSSPTAPDRPDAVLGNYFTIGGASYKTISYSTCPYADLRIWHIQGTFPTNVRAPLYTGSSEVGQSAMIFGRGVPASSSVLVDGNLKGWNWVTSSYDGQRSWGRNMITDLTTSHFLVTLFDPVVGQNEGHITYGDSSGGVFINDGGTWKLAGLISAIDGPYKYALSDSSFFSAALFNQNGLYWRTGATTFAATPDRPSAAYATSISCNITWIGSIVPSAIPEPGILSLLGGASILLLRRRQ